MTNRRGAAWHCGRSATANQGPRGPRWQHPVDNSADELCATARITHSFFAAAAKLPLRPEGILFHVKHGTRKCRNVGFRRDAVSARVSTGLFRGSEGNCRKLVDRPAVQAFTGRD